MAWRKFVSLDYKVHLLVSLVVRLALVAYGVYHDQVSSVPYTDIDYKVFTDAARHVLDHKSPFERHTYRYSPLVAYLMIPNITLHSSFGKILFCIIDLIDATLIRIIVKTTLHEYFKYVGEPQNCITGRSRKKTKTKKNDQTDTTANLSLVVWLYNPLTLAIATRGNCDSIAVFFVLATLYLLQCRKQYFAAGLIHGLSIHFRLYPIVYSLTFYMYLSKFSFYSLEDRRKSHLREITGASDGRVATRKPERKTIFKRKYLLYLVPNFDQIRLVQGCILSLFSLIGIFYFLYGYKFVYETYLYHFTRKDTRHNFSLYFYLQYLTAWIKNIGIWQKVLVVLPQLVLLLVFSFRYGLNRFSLNFSVLAQTIVMVTYNSVLTSQYFVWIMAVLPLCLWQIRMSVNNAIFLVVVWFAAQGAWLLPAYFLEFHGQNTFLFIWIQSVSFFCANIAILGRLIMFFAPVKKEV
ncbi:GPI mannosyltransferase 1-like Protein [Tribolium castaneum]|uniref:GPI alpha-1,4-mannosyltransferase I, catalytic subunit n=1 Tax=Tribolium castaneum TaxID=7070 RepID=D6WI72_TRICA|nr:PREDICTED: GPI mannosyltransferase 1 [Tribolium castaneum]EFA00721.2 GPI mannosyltransferase 1-like Protein [Tribolium castaneum]|eukprot:XP_008191963.1 PREDICTED: GPI mannosyltransferase 1 [Tribolium castaneum]